MRYQGKEASTWNQKLLDTENDPERRKLLEQIADRKSASWILKKQRVFSEGGRRHTDGEKTCIDRG